MKGIIFNAVEAAVVDLFSDDVWDTLLEKAGVDGVYTSIGTYDDTELLALVVAGCELTGLEPDDLVRTLGVAAFPHLVGRHPEFIDDVADTRAFLRSIDEIIHPEVMKLHPDARPPRFEYEDRDDGALRLTYVSKRRLGALAEGLIEGAGGWFNEAVKIVAIGDDDGGDTRVYDVYISPIDGT